MEEDDEFEEFAQESRAFSTFWKHFLIFHFCNKDWHEEDGEKEDKQYWQAIINFCFWRCLRKVIYIRQKYQEDWDNDDVSDDFSKQLRAELDKFSSEMQSWNKCTFHFEYILFFSILFIYFPAFPPKPGSVESKIQIS